MSQDAAVDIDVDPGNSVLGKLTLLLDAFSFDHPELSLSELVRRSGLHKPTVHRLCTELIHWGYLERHGIRYRLGIRLFEIGQRVCDQGLLRDAARPVMDELQRMTGGVVHLSVRSGTEVLYVEKITGRAQVQPSRIAGRMPMHCTASGKVLLAHGSPELVNAVLAGGLRRLTPYTITVPAQLTKALAQVRAAGFAKEFEETRHGYLSVAAPVRGAGHEVVAALSLTVPTVRADVPALARAVLRGAAEASARFAGAGRRAGVTA
ncbi:IclR family transcriptional regulator [Actinocrispum wychmicini]|uniref:IclR family transcriptional regulator n=1 Tax=Actinocrispum wychmicini TaxID=1213861 RepID=A0A4R2JUZ9_9PSEU|nr:IclR family transcriptional regulator [Actinocrispum wychmicini]TCO61116.1 IclR family transcriptional regulator [Actinocrispum wychmicini]